MFLAKIGLVFLTLVSSQSLHAESSYKWTDFATFSQDNITSSGLMNELMPENCDFRVREVKEGGDIEYYYPYNVSNWKKLIVIRFIKYLQHRSETTDIFEGTATFSIDSSSGLKKLSQLKVNGPWSLTGALQMRCF